MLGYSRRYSLGVDFMMLNFIGMEATYSVYPNPCFPYRNDFFGIAMMRYLEFHLKSFLNSNFNGAIVR